MARRGAILLALEDVALALEDVGLRAHAGGLPPGSCRRPPRRWRPDEKMSETAPPMSVKVLGAIARREGDGP
jgi:hypothetical protein